MFRSKNGGLLVPLEVDSTFLDDEFESLELLVADAEAAAAAAAAAAA